MSGIITTIALSEFLGEVGNPLDADTTSEFANFPLLSVAVGSDLAIVDFDAFFDSSSPAKTLGSLDVS